MTPAEILRAAKAKIADPAHWCQGVEARNEEGEEVFCQDEGACQWCAIGATGTLVPSLSDLGRSADAFLNSAAEQMGYPETTELPAAAHLNDTTDHATVMKMFDRAIELAESNQC